MSQLYKFSLLNGLKLYFPEYVGSVHLPTILPYVSLIAILGFILSIVPGLIYIERVVMAFMQDRSGPNRVGPRGLLQTIADGVKLFFKEDIQPNSVDVKIYFLAPILALIPALSAGAVLPVQMFYFLKDAHLVSLLPFTLQTATHQPFIYTGDPGSLLPGAR